MLEICVDDARPLVFECCASSSSPLLSAVHGHGYGRPPQESLGEAPLDLNEPLGLFFHLEFDIFFAVSNGPSCPVSAKVRPFECEQLTISCKGFLACPFINAISLLFTVPCVTNATSLEGEESCEQACQPNCLHGARSHTHQLLVPV